VPFSLIERCFPKNGKMGLVGWLIILKKFELSVTDIKKPLQFILINSQNKLKGVSSIFYKLADTNINLQCVMAQMSNEEKSLSKA
jgi:hypothetical protein